MNLSISNFPAATAAIMLIFCGCSSAPFPKDLSFASLTLVDHHDQKELPNPGSPESFAGIVGGRSLTTGPEREKPHDMLLLAKLTSATDFSRLSYSSTLNVRAYFCARPAARIFLSLPYIFMWGHDIRLGPVLRAFSDGASSGLYTYDIYIRVSLPANSIGPSRPSAEPFDLWEKPEDVCLQFVGGEYRALGFASNTIIISREQISGALHRTSATPPP